jgi:hypothetical protein
MSLPVNFVVSGPQVCHHIFNFAFINIVVVEGVVTSFETSSTSFGQFLFSLATSLNVYLGVHRLDPAFGEVEVCLCVEGLAVQLERDIEEEPANMVSHLRVRMDLLPCLLFDEGAELFELFVVAGFWHVQMVGRGLHEGICESRCRRRHYSSHRTVSYQLEAWVNVFIIQGRQGSCVLNRAYRMKDDNRRSGTASPKENLGLPDLDCHLNLHQETTHFVLSIGECSIVFVE